MSVECQWLKRFRSAWEDAAGVEVSVRIEQAILIERPGFTVAHVLLLTLRS
jgi:hypothetical protein